MQRQRNGMIDLMRFVLTVMVALVHLIDGYLTDKMTVLRGGTIAVEFFFILSGFLLAASAEQADRSQPVWASTYGVMKRKVCSIYPAWITALALCVLDASLRSGTGFAAVVRQLEESPSAFLMLTDLGLHDPTVIAYSWYIPVMLVCTLALYPVLHRWGRSFGYIAAPLIALFGCTYLFHTFGKLFTLQREWLGFTWAATVRGLCEMCLGVAAYEASMRLKDRLTGRLTRTGRTVFTVIELGALAYAMRYVCTQVRANVMLGVLLCFASFITLTYTGLGWTGEVVKGRLWSRLGTYSLSMYLGQSIAVRMAGSLVQKLSVPAVIAVYLVMVFAVGLAVHLGAWTLRRLFRLAKARMESACIRTTE